MKKETMLELSRRGFMKGVTAVTAAAALAGCSSGDDDDDYGVIHDPNAIDLREVRKVYSTCPVECLTHSLSCQLIGDSVVRVEPTRKLNDRYFTTACARGMSRMQFLTENRVTTPMKRIKKGTATSPLGVVLKDNNIDQFVSISWDQAFREIGEKLKALKDDRGVMVNMGSGNMGPVVNTLIGTFFAFAAPNRVSTKGNMCCQGADDGMTVAYSERGIDTRDTINESKCIICWGNNPAVTTNTYWKFFIEAKEKGAKIITIDPRFSVSAESSDMWLPINPGTDTLTAIGMLRHIFANFFNGSKPGWVDENFLKHRTNAAYLVDLSTLKKDDNTLVLYASAANKAYNDMYNLAYHAVSGKPQIYDITTTNIADAEDNGGIGAETQDPDLYYNDGSYTTVFMLMLALYAGDMPVVQAKFTTDTDLEFFHDPTYSDANIAMYTGVPIADINKCAEFFADSGASMIIQNMGGAMRTENGGHMAALQCVLTLVTGNVGRPGTGVDDTSGYGSFNGRQAGDPAKVGTAGTYVATSGVTPPVATPGVAGYTIPFGVLGRRAAAANNGNPQDVFLPIAPYTGQKDPQIKFWYIATLNLLTQYPNTGALKEALRSTETVVVAKPTWNTDADYCDYFLPVTTPFEYHDLGAANRNKYVQVMEAGVKPYGQSLSDMQIIRGIAKYALDANAAAVFDHDDEFYVKDIVENPANNFASNGITYVRLQEEKTIRPSSIPSPLVPFRNLEFNGGRGINKRAKLFMTEWQNATTYPYPRNPNYLNPAKQLLRGPFPRFVPAMESQLPELPDFPLTTAQKALRAEYPLNCVQVKVSRSVHASFTGLPWIREAFGDKGVVYIHPEDALNYGISNGETVTVTGSIGSVERVAHVTKLIRKGVTGIENGWWDKFGPLSSSTVGAELPDPMGCGHTHNNTLVKITKGGMK